jgi:hypothetical protein
MALRLRTGPPRRRQGDIPAAAGVALAALAVLAIVLVASRRCGGGASATVNGPVYIQRLEGVAAEALLPPTPRPFLDRHRIVAYYGNPLAAGMGILGEYKPEEIVRRLRTQADAYQRLDESRTVVPAVHFIYAVAQERPGREGLYLTRMEDELVEEWVRLTRDEGMLLFLDIQFGRSTIDREFPHVTPFLKEPHVHLALDPEFAWGPDEYPLIDIGHIDAGVVNRTQDLLQQFVIENRLPNKILVVHQFRPDMLRDKASIRPSDWVETVIDADGFGSPSLKLDQWNRVIRDDNVQRAGIKLFYKQDAKNGGLMSEADVMGLTPIPLVIIYQ